MSSRVERLRALLEEPLLVSNATNVRYLVGFASSNAALLVEPDRVRLFTDFRYAEGARAVAGVEFVETSRYVYRDLPGLLSGRIGFEPDDLTVARYERLLAGGLELVPGGGLVELFRAAKDDDELAAIRRAASITDGAYEQIAAEGLVGKRERDIAWRMEELFHELGAEGPSFPVVVAAGPNGSRPHADSGDRVIEAGQTVVVDAGCLVDGYCSDCTRTFATGPLPADLQQAYEVCLEGQLAGLEAVRAGAHGREVDAIARQRIAEGGLGDKFGHGLGHGVGLLVHEAPALRPESEDILEPRNVVTVEPGIYLEGVGGVRIEDLVVVTEDGPEVLSSFPKDLTTVN
jgi:Xaa-Pro aminopeptidase